MASSMCFIRRPGSIAGHPMTAAVALFSSPGAFRSVGSRFCSRPSVQKWLTCRYSILDPRSERLRASRRMRCDPGLEPGEPRSACPGPDPGTAGSLGLEAGELHHFCPFFGVVSHVLCEIGRRIRRHRDGAQFRETLLDRRISDGRVEFLVEYVDD